MNTLRDFIDYVDDELKAKALVMPVYNQLGCKDDDDFFMALDRVARSKMALGKCDGFSNYTDCREFFQENEQAIMDHITACAQAEGVGVMSYIFSIKDVEAPDAQTDLELRGAGASDWVMSVVSRHILKHMADWYEIYCDYIYDTLDEMLDKLSAPELISLATDYLPDFIFVDFAMMAASHGDKPMQDVLEMFLRGQLKGDALSNDKLYNDIRDMVSEVEGLDD